MGYVTCFQGEFKLDKPLKEAHRAYLVKFSKTRRTKRETERTAQLADPVREAVGLPVGIEGAYYVGGDEPRDVCNQSPAGQCSLWCCWTPNEDGTAIVWNDNEKFWRYDEWVAYLIEHFLEPWGYVLNGEVQWRGEDPDDLGTIVVAENTVVAYSLHSLVSVFLWLGRLIYG